ncbi:MAG: hypothetical protein ACE5FF_10210 [Saprospiraceae bacterium]
MENPLDKLEETFEVDLPVPQTQTLDSYLDIVLADIRRMSEDLREQQYYVASGGKPWLEVRDDPGFQESVLHFFNPQGEYLQSVDGNVHRGKWRLLDGTNKIIIEQGGSSNNPSRSELFELAFLNNYFFILKKHGNQKRKKKSKYLVMGYEPYVTGLKWKDFVDLMYNEYRNQWGPFQNIIVVAVIILIIVVVLSLI